ncbi:hypothetical protein SDC9_159157 [bioreactor metagenome]|uniref:Uncharacterized protein n=1 Tax=bioreactor metagenome TaxID=1076179 RepID=A0A645FES8_9ZZZZ
MLTQAVALQQADHGQGQQDDERQIAGLDKAGPDGGQNLVQRKARRKSCADGGHDDHQHGVKAQREAGNDDEHADQRPQVYVYRHGSLRKSRPDPLRGGLYQRRERYRQPRPALLKKAGQLCFRAA